MGTFVLIGLALVVWIAITAVIAGLLKVVCLAKLKEDRLLVDEMWDAGLVRVFLDLYVWKTRLMCAVDLEMSTGLVTISIEKTKYLLQFFKRKSLLTLVFKWLLFKVNHKQRLFILWLKLLSVNKLVRLLFCESKDVILVLFLNVGGHRVPCRT